MGQIQDCVDLNLLCQMLALLATTIYWNAHIANITGAVATHGTDIDLECNSTLLYTTDFK
jgi:hypothetical protein